jgi:hypothetical protein
LAAKVRLAGGMWKWNGELSGCFLGLFAFDMGREQPEQARTKVRTGKNKRTLSFGEGRVRLLKNKKPRRFGQGSIGFRFVIT